MGTQRRSWAWLKPTSQNRDVGHPHFLRLRLGPPAKGKSNDRLAFVVSHLPQGRGRVGHPLLWLGEERQESSHILYGRPFRGWPSTVKAGCREVRRPLPLGALRP